MNVITDKISLNRVRNKSTYQLTLDNDFIVSDAKPDLEKIIREHGEVIIDEYKIGEGKIDVIGKLRFDILYLTSGENSFLNGLTEVISFKETINVAEIMPDSYLYIKCELDDLSINIINSRKISARGLISIYFTEEEMFGQNIAVNIDEEAEIKDDMIKYTQLVTSKKDIFRIKEEIALQTSKENINNILYYDVKIINCNTRIMNEKFAIKGDVVVFVLYYTEEGEYECLEKEIPYAGDIDLYDARENMIDNIEVHIGNKEIQVKQDEDGENRIIDIDITLDLNIKLYKEESIKVLKDLYSVKKYVTPKLDEIEYNDLLLKNNTTFRLSERIELREKYKNIMQICNSMANIKLDGIEIVENGINIEGVVEVSILYISSDDREPICSFKEMLPFSHFIEANNIIKKCVYDIIPYIEQINVSMLARDEIEVKIGISLDTIIFNKVKENVIVDIDEREFTKEEIDNMCSMIGYRVKDNDTLWTIAKTYNTTVDMLKEINNIVDKEIKTGDKLLIVRKNVA